MPRLRATRRATPPAGMTDCASAVPTLVPNPQPAPAGAPCADASPMRSAARCLVALGIVLYAEAVSAQPRTDVVVLGNGDRITGEVVRLARGRLEFKTDE